MNNSTRKHIATLTDAELSTAIAKCCERLGMLSQVKTIKRSVQTRLNALNDERQARMLGTHAFY